MGTFGTTWMLMKASWGVVKNNKRLLILPIVSTICLLIVLASFVAPVVAANWGVITGREELRLAPKEGAEEGELNLTPGIWEYPAEGAPASDYVRFYGVALAFYFCNYFVIIFFNSAIVAAALFWMRDGQSSLSRGLGAAAKRLPQVAGWALLSAFVGLLLRVIESHKHGARIVASILGTAWTIMTYLAVPVLVVEGKGPFGALKGSISLLRKTWGQQLVGGFGFGIIYFLLALVGFAIIGAGAYLAGVTGSAAVGGLLVAAGVIYFALLVLVSSVMGPVFQAALYVYAKEGQAPESFGAELLSSAFRTK
jgi:hypothetical protein